MALQKVTIGFAGPHILAVKMQDTALDELLQAVAAGDWRDLTVEEGTIRLNLSQVVYVRTEREEHRVGFSSG